MTKTSHKKNRPFDFKLIDLVEPHPVLYQRETGLSTYNKMKAKNLLWEEISEKLEVSVQFCIMRWGNLRGQFQKELRHCRELCPKEGVIRGSTWPYLERLRFLENTVQFNRPKRVHMSKRQNKAKFEVNEEQDSMTSDDLFEYEVLTENNENGEDTCDMVFKSADDLIDELLDDGEHFTVIKEEVVLEIPRENTDIKNAIEKQPTRSSDVNFQKMSTLLVGIEGDNMVKVERRIMAFLCKCQLRALLNEGVDDLVI